MFLSVTLNMAINNLRACYETRYTDRGCAEVIIAGKRNFREPWARDSVFSSFGACEIGDFEPVKNTFELFLHNQSLEGQIPNCFSDRGLPVKFSNWSGRFKNLGEKRGILKPIYKTSVKTKPVDPNPLIIIGVNNYVKKSGDIEFAYKNYSKLEKAIQWIQNQDIDNDLLVEQPECGDWADSLIRKGKLPYANICYYKALQDFSELSYMLNEKVKSKKYLEHSVGVREKINETFWNEKNGFYDDGKSGILQTDGNVLAALWNAADRKKAEKIQSKIKEFKLDNPVPLKTVYNPKYRLNEISPLNILLGIPQYHNGASWPWLGNLNAIVKMKLGYIKEAKKDLLKISNLAIRDGGFFEVFSNRGVPLRSFIYKSEMPFAWSAGAFIYAVKAMEKQSASI